MYPVKWKFPSDFRHNEITSFWAPTWVADIHESLWDLIPPPHPLWTEIGPKICSTLRKYASMALKTVWNEHFWRQKTNIFGVRIGLKIVKSCLRCVEIAGYTNGVEIHWNVNMDLQKHVLSKNRSCQEWSDSWERDAENHGLSPKSGGASTRNTGQVLGKWR